jgi:hypothetical protein
MRVKIFGEDGEPGEALQPRDVHRHGAETVTGNPDPKRISTAYVERATT